MTDQAKAKPTNAGKNLPGRAVTLKEARDLMRWAGSSPSGLRNAAFVALCFGAGLRCSEALAVKPSDIERKPDGTFVSVTRGKGGKSRQSVLLGEFLPVIDRWLDCRDRLGVSAKSPIVCGITQGTERGNFGKPLSTAQMRGTISRMTKKAGLTHRIHVHGLRHGHATLLADLKTDFRSISGQLGHSNLAITDRYLAKIHPAERLRSIGSIDTTSK